MSDSIEIRALEVGDAESLVTCFGRCYDGTYVAEVFNDARLARSEIEAGRLRSVVAVDSTAGIVAHMGLQPRIEHARIAEMGNTVVDPRFRGRNLTPRLTLELVGRCRSMGLVGFIHYPTTAHTAMQKMAAKANGIELGLLFDYIPSATRYVGFEARDAVSRIAVVAVYHALDTAPTRRVWMPLRHCGLARRLYGRLGLDREVVESLDSRPPARSRIEAVFDRRRGLLRIEVETVGASLSDSIAAEMRAHPAAPVIVDLPLNQPGVGFATETLARSGFFYAAILPEYVPGSDVLRLQWIENEPVEPRLETAESRRLFAYSMRDRVDRTA